MKSRFLQIVSEDVRQILQHDLPWERFAGRTILVTGAGGFLGSYLVRTLLELYPSGRISMPAKVIALVRDEHRARARFADLSVGDTLGFMQWDMSCLAIPDIGGASYVIHAASQASPRFYGSDPVGTILPNTIGTAALLTALERSADPQGMLFVSTSEVYGAVSKQDGLREADYGVVDPAAVRSCYGEGKRAGEATCVAWSHQRAVPTYIVRPFHTYGPGLAAGDGRVFADFVYNVVNDENIVMNSDGSARRAFCYVSDAVGGFFTVLLKGQHALPYNVANPHGELSVFELAQLLVGLVPDKALSVERRQPSRKDEYLPSTYNRLVPDVARLEGLGWRPRVSPAEGFRRTIEASQ